MRMILHWLIFLALLGPLLWAGLARLHYTSFGLFMAILIAVTLSILGVFMVAEKRAPTPDDSNQNSNLEEHR